MQELRDNATIARASANAMRLSDEDTLIDSHAEGPRLSGRETSVQE
jgi:hypothetical protein